MDAAGTARDQPWRTAPRASGVCADYPVRIHRVWRDDGRIAEPRNLEAVSCGRYWLCAGHHLCYQCVERRAYGHYKSRRRFPASGIVVVTGSGESTAKSNFAGNAFIGLAYSIARDSNATDNGNVAQSSALAVFNGDANRDFLNVQRVDACTPGQPTPIPDRLRDHAANQHRERQLRLEWPAHRQRGPASSSFAAGTTYVNSATNATPTS